MVILFGATGQLCNRLFNLSAFICNALEEGYRLHCLGFEEYYPLFENINREFEKKGIWFNEPGFVNSLKAGAFYKSGSVIRRLKPPLRIPFTGIFEKGGDLKNVSYQQAVRQHHYLFVGGWPYWDVENFIKYSEVIKKVFQPKMEYRQLAGDFINRQKERYDILVGVHVRRGDYKEYNNGRFYYTDEIYLKIIESLQQRFAASSKKVLFIIFSNEKVSIQSAGVAIIKSELNAICDLTAMTKCDYLIGPPSTFSMWASFYGSVPHQWIIDPHKAGELSGFSPIVAPNTYQNGVTINLEAI